MFQIFGKHACGYEQKSFWDQTLYKMNQIDPLLHLSSGQRLHLGLGWFQSSEPGSRAAPTPELGTLES